MGAPVLLLALLFNAPVLWRACVEQDVPVQTAVTRVLLAVPVAWLLIGGVRLAMRGGDRDS
jgi:hypothetical protein